MPPPVSDDAQRILKFLYGAQTAAALRPRLAALIRKHPASRGARKPRGPALPLTEKDALLITYADQVRQPGQSPLRTLAGFCRDHFAGLVSGVHLLPFFPSSSDDGFSVMDYRVVDPALGDWDDVRELGRSFDLMLDGVFNHVSARSDWFEKFLHDDPVYRDYFITVEGEPDLSGVVRPRTLPLLTAFETAGGTRKVWTTFSPDQVDLNLQNPRVLLELLDVLLFYVDQGARYVRLDAIAYAWKELGTSCIHHPKTHALVRLMRAVLDSAAPEVMLVTETNVPHVDNVSYFGDGRNEAQLVYNFALPPLVLHALRTGDGTVLTRWAQTLTLPSRRVTFLNFLASHDGIGLNPVRGILSEQQIQETLVEPALAHGGYVSYKTDPDGSRSPYELNISFFDALSEPFDEAEPAQTKIERFLVAQAILLALAGLPALYFHSLVGSRNDRVGAELSGIPRRINRQKLDRVELERELADQSTARARVLAGCRRLLQVRRARTAFHPASRQTVLATDPRAFVVLRLPPDRQDRVVCCHNLAREPVRLTLESEIGRNPARELLADEPVPRPAGKTWEIHLAPYQVSWIACPP